MVAYKSAIVIVLTELVDPENEKPLRRKTREWIKSRREREREWLLSKHISGVKG